MLQCYHGEILCDVDWRIILNKIEKDSFKFADFLSMFVSNQL